MHSATLVLEGVHTGPFCSLSIHAHNNLIFQGQAENHMRFNFPYPDVDRFIIKIKKTGKAKEIVDKKFKQEIIVSALELNGCDMHADKFGNFFQFDNSYVADQKNYTNKLYLNGEWNIDLPIFDYSANQSALHELNLRDAVIPSDIACFGCSFTYGANLQPDETWPYFLNCELPGKVISNYGRGGNSVQEIMSTALEYARNNAAKSVICLLPHPSRMQVIDPASNTAVTLYPGHASPLHAQFTTLCNDVVMYGETSLLLAGYVISLKKIAHEITATGKKLFVSCYDEVFYKALKNLHIDDMILLPYYERDSEHPCSDDQGHPGAIHNRLFAENIVKYIS